MTNKTVFILCAVALILLTAPAVGQIIYGQPTTGDLRVIYSSWTADYGDYETSVSQFFTPVSGMIPLKDNLEMRFYSAMTSNNVDVTLASDGSTEEFSLSGISDLRFQFNRSLSEDRMLVGLGLNLPTGKKELNAPDEWPVMQALSSNYLDFPIRRLGEGMGINLLFGGATYSGSARLGGTIMYQINGKYKPYEGDEDYDPGDFLTVNGGWEKSGEKTSVSVNASYSIYGTDKSDGQETFKSGNSLSLSAAISSGSENMKFTGAIGFLLRDRNTRYTLDTTSTAYKEDQLKLYGNEFNIAGGATIRMKNEIVLTPHITFHSIGDDESIDYTDGSDTDGSGSIIGIGSGASRSIGEGINMDISMTFFTGSALGGDVDLSGFQFGIGITATF